MSAPAASPLSSAEIEPGLILHLDPAAFLRADAICTAKSPVEGPHAFLCTSVTGTMSRWLPLYTNDGPGRVQLESKGRTGHPWWVGGTFHWHQQQVWVATEPRQVVAALLNERSTPGNRNRLDAKYVPKI